MHKILRRSIFIFLTFASFIQLNGQTNSPYSRIGLGDLRNLNYADLRGMGDISAAFNSSYSVNFSNPAALSYLQLTSFQVGLDGEVNTLKTTDQSDQFEEGSISYLSLAFPIAKRMGFQLGLSPFSTVAYNVIENNDDVSVPFAQRFEGEGTTYQLFGATGYGIADSTQHFSLGVKGAYTFGTLDNQTNIEYPDSLNTLNVRKTQSREIRDFVFSLGAQYKRKIGDNHSVTVGVSGNLESNMRTRKNELWQTFRIIPGLGSNVGVDIKDTLLNVEDFEGDIVLPLNYQAGILFQEHGRWKLGANYNFTKWSAYNSFGESDNLADSYKLSVGGEWVPSVKSNRTYLESITYRVGGYVGESQFQVNGEQLKDNGITFGLGIPMRWSFPNSINLAFTAGKLGTTDNDLIQENYFKGTIGFDLNSKWFIKRKID